MTYKVTSVLIYNNQTQKDVIMIYSGVILDDNAELMNEIIVADVIYEKESIGK